MKIDTIFLGNWTNYSITGFPHKPQHSMPKEKYIQNAKTTL